MTFGDAPFLAASMIFVTWASSAKADGIAETLMQPDPCWTAAFTDPGMADLAVIDEADTAAQEDLFAMNCGRIPTVAQMVASYVPNHPTMYWDQPPLLPETPAPVPLPATAFMLLTAMLALVATKGIKNV